MNQATAVPTELVLRDIHLPPAVSWWPPAPGWWLLLLLLLVGGAGAALWWRRHRQRRYQRLAFQQIAALQQHYDDSGDGRFVVQQLSQLLRHMAVLHYDRQKCAAIHGEEWLQFLDGPFGDKRPFSCGAGQCLALGPYQPLIAQEDIAAVIVLSRQWIKLLPLYQGRGGDK